MGERIFIVIALVLMVTFSLCIDNTQMGPETVDLTVYVGGCMTTAYTELASDFMVENPGVNVIIVAKSNVKLMDILDEFKEGDVFIPDDGRVADEAVEAGYLDDYTVVATSHMAIFVPEGNPKDIHGLDDLKNDTIRVILGRPDNPMGIALREILGNSSTLPEIMNNYVCIQESKCVAFPGAVVQGDVDAAITCSPSGLRTTGLEIIETPELSDAKFNVTIGVLNFSEEPEMARKFADFATSERGKAYLEKYGYDII